MRFAFQPLPWSDHPRPVVAVNLDGALSAPFACPGDTGSLHNRFPAWLARHAGIDLADVEADKPIALGGLQPVIPRTVRCSLQLPGGLSWDAPVSFCDPWPVTQFGLLGQEGFFRYFRVEFLAGHEHFDIEPDH